MEYVCIRNMIANIHRPLHINVYASAHENGAEIIAERRAGKVTIYAQKQLVHLS
jgi:hypothetical protein